MEFDLENPLTHLQDLHSSDAPSLFLIESDHMLSQSYLHSLQASPSDFAVRRDTISLISHCSSNSNIDPHFSYLAVNYLDRFFSIQGVPQPKPWVLRLLAVACVSLAAKMKQTDHNLFDFMEQSNEGFIFDPQTLHRMEVLILGALKWRMRSITPFSFIPFFISLFKLRDPPFLQALKARATEIIFIAQNGIEVLEFKPSVIAAAALLSASHELFPIQYPCFRKAILECSYGNTEEMLVKCFERVQEIVINGYERGLEMEERSDTEANVLDHHFSSSESENTFMPGRGSSSLMNRADKGGKKRKVMVGYCKNQTVRMSQIQQC
ncbi:putative cyclin-D6-1 [Cucurbita pepo subsp. pepo]|uniref:putative cyclin-D6-1 n=1 Tax=Cucurbita pepo subsp. pepo TaxID=3664 RepID=UPI000C9D55D1|nr:putative cyclin-D6-1 [Cucurbita pepo subsp. pepo]